MTIDAPVIADSSAPTANESVTVADPATKPEHTPEQAKLQTLESMAEKHLNAHPGFDPAIHAISEDGTPKRRADGSYAMKRGRKAGGSHLPPRQSSGTASPLRTAEIADGGEVGAPINSAPRIAPDEAARQSANLVINAAVWICGEEIGKPSDKAEAEGLKISFVNYYESRGVPNIPPEIGLVLALGSYLAPRLRATEEKTGKISNAITWIKFKLGFRG